MTARRDIEAPEFAAFTRRILRALARRAAAGDVEALPELQAVVADAEAALHTAVDRLHYGPDAYSWTEIGDRLGVSRQAARQRFARKDTAAGDESDRGGLRAVDAA